MKGDKRKNLNGFFFPIHNGFAHYTAKQYGGVFVREKRRID